MRSDMTRDNKINFGGSFAIDTTFVLFFLTLELGRSASVFGFDTLLLSITTMMMLVLPYFLPSGAEPPAFAPWLAFRGLIAAVGVGLGVMLPLSLGFMPMTFLIIAAMISCYVQFYSLFKLRLAK
ncbi:MAG: hypothetical protein IPK01_12700 [Acidobacteria bacterium]|nr:hypothetical protein [Acidobacteriota bacterium]